MALQLKRGLEEDRSLELFVDGEPAYVTDTYELYIGDGITAGGNPLLVRAVNVPVDVSAFSKNLGPTDVNVQHALETIDQMAGGGITVQQAIMYGLIGG